MKSSQPRSTPALTQHLGRGLRRAVGCGIGLAVGFGGASLMSGADAQAELPQQTTVVDSGSAEQSAQQRRVERLSRRHECSAEGTAGVIPTHAIVRDESTAGADAIRLTSFDEGWAVHLGEVPGDLVALCLR